MAGTEADLMIPTSATSAVATTGSAATIGIVSAAAGTSTVKFTASLSAATSAAVAAADVSIAGRAPSKMFASSPATCTSDVM